ncbi:MAG: PAS domain S-box protein [Candidatus Kapaibacteriota bacterium]
MKKVSIFVKKKIRYIVAGILFTIFLALSLIFNFNYVEMTSYQLALENARTNFQKDLVFRKWASSIGGIYAPSDKVQPNPYLVNHPFRDLETLNGTRLTLVNPAYMMRLIYEIEKKEKKITSKIISLKPINPQNKPDSLEEAALLQFEKGKKEHHTLIKNESQRFVFKYIAPLMTTQECLTCHSTSGYKVGDIRDAISISLPYEPYLEHTKNEFTHNFISHFVVWSIGLILLVIIYKHSEKQEKLLLDEKENYEILTELSPAAIVVHQNERFVFANKSAMEMLEADSLDAIIGKEVLSILHPESLELAKKRIEKMVKGQEELAPLTIEKIITKKGNVKVIETTAKKVKFNGKSAILTIARDLTELEIAHNQLKKQEEEIRKSEEKFRLFFENNEAVILLINPENQQIVYANKAAEKFYGWSIEELTKMSIAQINTMSLEEIKEKMAEARKKGQNYFNFKHRLKNGEIRDVEVYQSKLSLDSNELFSIIIHDITERKKAEEALLASETKFKKLFEEHVAVKLLIDPEDGKIINANKAAAEFYGWSIEELTKMKISDINSLTPAEMRQKMQNALTRKENFFEFKHRLANGEIRDVAVYSSSIEIEGKKYLHSIVTDITSRKKAEEQVKNNEKFLDYLIDSLPIPVFFKDINGKYFKINKAFINLLGYAKEEVIGKDIFEIYKNKDLAEIYALKDKELYILGGKQVYETKMAVKNGDQVDVILHNNLFYERNGAVGGIIGAIIDVSKIKETEAKLIEAKQKAEESDKLKSLFLANVSHEIRTPMNGILGFSQLLKDPKLKQSDIKEYIDIIEKSGNRMLNIINDIIDISKIEANQMQVNLVECDINEQMRFIYSFFRPELEKKGLEFNVHYGLSNDNSIIITDKDKIYASLLNLIKNAIKFTDKGEISFGYAKKGDFLEFYVRDTGSGIPSEKLGIIFDRFVQADTRLSKPYEGAGLGLSITRGYVEMLGGQIWAESEFGLGSTFFFTIPFKAAEKRKNEDKYDENMGQEGNKMKRLKILIAEDDITSDLLLTSIFKRFDCEIVHTQTGKEAVEAFAASPDFDLILMDLKMPEMDGYTATNKIKEINPNVVVIAQTAYALEGDREKAIAAGCDEYITKPIEQGKLLELIKKYY